MNPHELRSLLDGVPDTRELVLHSVHAATPEQTAWRDARDEASGALRAWLAASGDRAAYAAYRAAQDREDAAMDAVRHTQTARLAVA